MGELNPFEQEIVKDLLGCDWKEWEEVITPESCKRLAAGDRNDFDWEDIKAIRACVDYVEQVPADLVALACNWAWSQVRWDLVTEVVKARLEAR